MAKIRERALRYLREKVTLHDEYYIATFLVPGLRHLKGLSSGKRDEVVRIVKDRCEAIRCKYKYIFF